jgi:glycogen operon protein
VPAEVQLLRERQAKNFCALLLLANGLPMFCAGDEFLHTQRGNNNPYNQNNETTWLDWSRLEAHAAHFRFFKMMIAFRRAHATLCRIAFGERKCGGTARKADRITRLFPFARVFLSGASHSDVDLYVMVNAWWEPLMFQIQEGQSGMWRRVLDTGLPSPHDFSEPGQEPVQKSQDYELGPRSVAVLLRCA